MGNWHVVLDADPLYVFHNLVCHILVVILEVYGTFDRKATSDIYGVQFRAYFLELTIFINKTAQFAPIVGCVLNARINEEVKHFQLSIGFWSNFVFIKVDDRSEEHTSELQS